MARWVIDFADIFIARAEPIGAGSYGVVYRGRWKGVDVAVKRFPKQSLTERAALDFRAEVAFLSELSHPNVVLFIGACVQAPNLCVVTEYVARGSLSGVLAGASGQRLALACGCACCGRQPRALPTCTASSRPLCIATSRAATCWSTRTTASRWPTLGWRASRRKTPR
ncbi:Protein kinase catalytic incomplete domain containing protein [Pandoravirus celtis]|uniref:non-specific serine/threonine protein kinase n=1 Tax=Pandoravirus celtis TaxID=2568002 RepID=A0A4D6EI03_9VIRU|nr:Protein kinase catalytic incomplete domain containing protein [Pandoravirus celtis]